MSFYHNSYIGLSAISREAVYCSPSNARRIFSEGDGTMTSNPFAAIWTNNYAAINYANMFLDGRKGYNTQYMLNQEADLALRRSLQGDAFGLRAWMLFGLLKMFAGEGTDGQMHGVPILTEPSEMEMIDASKIVRASIDDCCRQILEDCDSAVVYLKESNRDFPDDAPQTVIVTGSARYTTLDGVAINALRAQTYLYWASPAWNPDRPQDDPVILERYANAARYASEVMRFKLEKESTFTGGFDPSKKVEWTNPNSQEIVWCSRTSSSTTTWETSLYPIGFGGTALIAPTQELVDCFPDAKGYPITESTVYDPAHPYKNRDPRFYSTINYDGAEVRRNTNPDDVMYTFNTRTGGQDAPGLTSTSTSGYYLRKFLYNGWNPYDVNIQSAPRPLMLYRWSEMCLIFAEAAANTVSPLDAGTYGYSARQALAWLRSRPTSEDVAGVGSSGDPYLDLCAAAGGKKFLDLVKNEWRIETCFEGQEFYNCRRWATSVDEINGPVTRVLINGDGDDPSYDYETVTTLKFPSLWAPLPYLDVRRCPSLVQNKGYESWR